MVITHRFKAVSFLFLFFLLLTQITTGITTTVTPVRVNTNPPPMAAPAMVGVIPAAPMVGVIPPAEQLLPAHSVVVFSENFKVSHFFPLTKVYLRCQAYFQVLWFEAACLGLQRVCQTEIHNIADTDIGFSLCSSI